MVAACGGVDDLQRFTGSCVDEFTFDEKLRVVTDCHVSHLLTLAG
jgi:hypothetical protein